MVDLSAGPAEIVAIHCTLAHSGAWRGFARALEGRARVRAFDLPSHGRSADWHPGEDQHGMATDWGLSLLERPVHLVGHSYGATVALRMACERPDLVLSATLVEPVFFAATLADTPEAVAAHNAELADYDAAVSRGDMAGAARAFNRLWGDGTRWADIPDATRDYMTERIHFVQGSQPFVIRDDAGLLERGALERMRLPVLLVEGSDTLEVIRATHAAMARRIPGVQRVVIPGAGHMAPITHAGALAEIVERLL